MTDLWATVLVLYVVAGLYLLARVHRWSHSEERRRELAVRRLKKAARTNHKHRKAS